MSGAKPRTWLFASLTAAALGFGTSQVFAAPAAPATRFACNPWDEPRCITYCQEQMGADTGTCQEGYHLNCKCIWW